MITFNDGKVFPVRKRYLYSGVFLNHPRFLAERVLRGGFIIQIKE